MTAHPKRSQQTRSDLTSIANRFPRDLNKQNKNIRLFAGVARQQLSHSTVVRQGLGYTNGVSDGMSAGEVETQSGECTAALK